MIVAKSNGIRSATRGRVDRCPARAAAAVSAADPTFWPEYSAHLFVRFLEEASA